MSRVFIVCLHTFLICTLLITITFMFMEKANAEKTVHAASEQFSIEVLALSRGRGVPAQTQQAMNKILALANCFQKQGKVIAVKQQAIGIEGETSLCILLKDEQVLGSLGNEIRALAANIDLLQVRDNSCSGN